jgi:hypothetical protein
VRLTSITRPHWRRRARLAYCMACLSIRKTTVPHTDLRPKPLCCNPKTCPLCDVESGNRCCADRPACQSRRSSLANHYANDQL